MTKYRYSMVQIPPGIVVDPSKTRGDEAAKYLQRIVNEASDQGWEFFRIDTLAVTNQPGCFGALTGQRADTVNYYVVTFRRSVEPGG